MVAPEKHSGGVIRARWYTSIPGDKVVTWVYGLKNATTSHGEMMTCEALLDYRTPLGRLWERWDWLIGLGCGRVPYEGRREGNDVLTGAVFSDMIYYCRSWGNQLWVGLFFTSISSIYIQGPALQKTTQLAENAQPG